MCLGGRGKRKPRRRCAHFAPVYFALGVAAVIWLIVMPPLLQRFASRRRIAQAAEDRYLEEGFEADTEPTSRRSTPPAPPKNPYEGAAIVSLAGGDASGRNFLALLQSLRDVGTTLPIIVLLARGNIGSAACMNHDWKKKVGRPDVSCTGPDTIGMEGRRGGRSASGEAFSLGYTRTHCTCLTMPIPRPSPLAAEEIISPEILELYKKLGAEIRVIPWIPRTKYTEGIPGGKEHFWGYSLNRLV
jgi:hypothetical protein